ncbi:glycoside hydrolase N-terminal domain-containing protein [Streptomyces sp. VRA16 Mangrove soil]|uniref:glycosyl hydrolase family 95 catalytic domain-containing protein n=1 Tax=Streptomyces sp. VRA16 Mangrove soil TaxID=2817434 RepID=UPI001A9D76E1|nr:glycoside hydrolase N-terminal domain-containing protein [Streptomyces sp. VRA16 Mangrove soil]MBO1329766.1 glycoside hydrolase family 95 protein [Streptomyces sp. VRA16 Mangrove soil]
MSPALSRRTMLGLGAALALTALPTFSAHAAPRRPTTSPLVPADEATTLWYSEPADEDLIIEQGLPLGNGRLGALVGGDPASELFHVTDVSLWTGGANDTLDSDGQLPYGRDDFGSLTLLARATLRIPGHDFSAVGDYRRALDLSNGLVTTTYTKDEVTYVREMFVSAPDDVLIVRLSQSGGGTLTGSMILSGTHGETTTADTGRGLASFSASFDNGLRYAAAVTAAPGKGGGTVKATGSRVTFADCAEVVIVLGGGTDYAPDHAAGYRDPHADPLALAQAASLAAASATGTALRDTHVADYRPRYEGLTLDLGSSTGAQRKLDTWSRLKARAADGGAPDPELEASYVQFGRYLTICGSRDGLPMGLQGTWLEGNTPDWMGDYHTDINLQMNYWLADRAGLGETFPAFADYCLAQLPAWNKITQEQFQDSRNRYRNTSEKVAGWTVAFSTNPYGGLGWWWHPAGNAWLCASLYEHYEFTQDTKYLARIMPLLKGACEFWEARLIATTVDGTEVLVDDHDWSPEHGPQDARGITYTQELLWTLFGHYEEACRILGRDSEHAAVVRDLRARLYLPKVSPTSGWLEEWMSEDNLGETTHRHLSPLINLFPGDRIRPDAGDPELLAGATELLKARGMESYGWACAWRAACWARLKDADKAYQLVLTNLKPWAGGDTGTAMNFFDMYRVSDTRAIFQIDANLGTPAAVMEMLVYSRPGHLELLPALPDAWAAAGSVKGAGVRGGFTLDMTWRRGRVREATLHSIGGRETTVTVGGRSATVKLKPGQSVALTGLTG